ncbi:MAG TPA: ABC transporter substrate-binding protein [Acidimicrobiia bacterium]|nr:ABC transporter substrate-binding protein [Acidimicrobiia bacterium]
MRVGHRVAGAFVALALSLTSLGWAGAPGAAAATSTAVGVTRTTVTVAGLVGADPASTGAEIGAQARFARANRHGGVKGRTVTYAGNAADPTTLSTSAFAAVPAVSDSLDAAGLARSEVPFVGSAATTAWDGNRFGFGFAGAQAALQTTVVSPAWGARLRALLGSVQGSTVSIAVDDSELGAARDAQARASLRAAGFRVAASVTVPGPPAPLPDLAPIATTLTAGPPTVVLLLTSPAATGALAQLLAQASFTGTVAADVSMYQPTAPAAASGLTVLVPVAPLEQRTPANRRLAADVEAFAPGTRITTGIAAGYWSADLFLRMLAATGKRLTRERFLAVARRFSYRVPSTIGPVRWPAAHRQDVPCGALVQSDGSQYVVAEPYACGTPIVVKPPKRSTTTTR